MIASFLPIEPPSARILILGTMPSVQSLKQRQYYANPQNMFWRLLFALWEKPLPADYAKRVSFIKEKRIALWDVLKACDREGSLDSSIKNPQPNDINQFLVRQPGIHTLFFNSQNAERFFKKLVANTLESPIKTITLPSSSPARAMRFEEKLARWRVVRESLFKVEK